MWKMEGVKKGIYCLVIDVDRDINPKVGALGRIRLKKGVYAYVGSAQNNLQKRIQRHLSKHKKIRWHIDYLLASPNVRIRKAMFRKGGKDLECRTACFLSEVAEPVPCFGCSDCSCSSHLFRLRSLGELRSLGFAAMP